MKTGIEESKTLEKSVHSDEYPKLLNLDIGRVPNARNQDILRFAKHFNVKSPESIEDYRISLRDKKLDLTFKELNVFMVKKFTHLKTLRIDFASCKVDEIALKTLLKDIGSLS